MNCATCTFSNVVEYDNGDIGLQCHRYPPQVFVLDGEVTQATPSVDEAMWCGEWTEAAGEAFIADAVDRAVVVVQQDQCADGHHDYKDGWPDGLRRCWCGAVDPFGWATS